MKEKDSESSQHGRGRPGVSRSPGRVSRPHPEPDQPTKQPDQQQEADRSQLAEGLEVQRVRVDDRRANPAVSVPPELERPGTDSLEAIGLERIDRGAPEIVAVTAGGRKPLGAGLRRDVVAEESMPGVADYSMSGDPSNQQHGHKRDRQGDTSDPGLQLNAIDVRDGGDRGHPAPSERDQG